MLTAGPLIRLMAQATEVPEATVGQFVRVLREAGLFTTGARGVNAPKVENLDVARLLIGLAVTDRPARAAQAVNDFGALTFSRFIPDKDSDPSLDLGTSVLEDAVSRIFNRFLDAGAEWPEFALQVELDEVQATIVDPTRGIYWFNHPDEIAADQAAERGDDEGQLEAEERFDAIRHRYKRKIRTTRTILGPVMAEIAAGFRGGAE